MRTSFFLVGLASILWFLFKTGSKPTRACYPCQQASAASGYLWLTTYMLPFVAVMHSPGAKRPRERAMILAGSLLLLASALFVSTNLFNNSGEAQRAEGEPVILKLSDKLADTSAASDIFVVNGTSGKDDGVKRLIDLMSANGLAFYAQDNASGIIGKDDVVIIKVNSQWDERGGTNTDLVKKLVEAIVNHPDGFKGEVIIADNGQDQYGSTGRGGSLSYARNNAEDPAQSMQKIADSFSDYRVSTYLWDTITTKQVKEYSAGDQEDGYVVDDQANPETGIVVSYPKFRTKYGTELSFKLGVWDEGNGTYNSDHLRVLNVPVLKSHGGYGVTASVKHYMGVVSDKLSREAGGRAHYSVARGGMGTEMVETRFPACNILDAIWVNARPGAGPSTSYIEATSIRVIAASTDPVALDYWAAKNILMPAARAEGYNDLQSMDPDNTSPGSFGDWLRLSMNEIRNAGHQATVDEKGMNIHVAETN